jgi:outer membrane protein assembly factor BamD
MSFFKKMLKPGRDPSKTVQALAEFKKVITDFPGSDQAKEAQDKVKACEERLAGHGFEIAYGYYQRRAYKASVSRLIEVMNLYPNFSGLDRLYYTLGDCYFLTYQFDQAVPYFSKVVTDYPGRKLAQDATKRLAEIEKLKKNPPVKKPPLKRK